MRSISLNGEWKLSWWDEQEDDPATKTIPARVPGNVEIDLMRAGELPDVFFGENIRLLRPYEFCTWKYERDFDMPALAEGQRAYLRFEGVDCVARYEIDGQASFESKNALIAHRFEITGLSEGFHRLAVILFSPLLYAEKLPCDASDVALAVNYESLRVRKAPSQYGWDIMPRVLSAGLWRGVYLDVEEPSEMLDVYFATLRLAENAAWMACAFEGRCARRHYQGLGVEIEMTCTGREPFVYRQPLTFPKGRCVFRLPDPKLWMPRGYGEQTLYVASARLTAGGETLAEKTVSVGVRTVRLERSESADAQGGEFRFYVNDAPVFLHGSNWVPADAFHSRDAGRYEKMLALARDLNCNVLRCWGGNVYEDHAFFDLCDRYGILVWQDFAMACGTYPRDDDFCRQMAEEAESVVKKLRNHPSLLLWSGDNECDVFTAQQNGGMNPADNRVTRETLPRVLSRLDPYRPYLPSSPYISPAAWAKDVPIDLLPETHLWGPRDYFKSPFYTQSPAHFVSETGYHGCNNLSSIRSFIDESSLWPWKDNPQWLAHAYEPFGPEGPYAYRIRLMADQIRELFGRDADCLEDFILASQISQAEAKKFFIELSRYKKWRRTGVIWWNLIDGWPQFSDAVVSYDFGKKLAYHYIKRSQRDLCLMFSEPESWRVRLMADNDTLRDRRGRYRVWDGDTGETVLEGEFFAPANQCREAASLRVSHADHRLLLMEWTADGERGVNHYCLGKPPFDLDTYRKWLEKIAALDDSFDATEVGK